MNETWPDKFGVSDYGEPSRVNPSFRSPLAASAWRNFLDHVTLFFRSHDQNRTASDSNFQRQFYHSTDFDSMCLCSIVNLPTG